jgi:DNA-binding GntR family transcriptional regulator
LEAGVLMDYGKLTLWRIGTKTEQVAAALAVDIKAGTYKKWDELPLNRVLADKLDCSERTISAAKNLLAEEAMLKLEGRRYYVA